MNSITASASLRSHAIRSRSHQQVVYASYPQESRVKTHRPNANDSSILRHLASSFVISFDPRACPQRAQSGSLGFPTVSTASISRDPDRRQIWACKFGDWLGRRLHAVVRRRSVHFMPSAFGHVRITLSTNSMYSSERMRPRSDCNVWFGLPLIRTSHPTMPETVRRPVAVPLGPGKWNAAESRIR